MKRTLFIICMAALMVASCDNKKQPEATGDTTEAKADTSTAQKQTTEEQKPEEEVKAETPDICWELAKYVRNGLKNDKVVLTQKARNYLSESTWPEIQCRETGDLDIVGANVTVKEIAKGKFVYSCDCTCGKERYQDNWIMCARINEDGLVEITKFETID